MLNRYDTVEEALQAFKAERHDFLRHTLEVEVGDSSLFIKNAVASYNIGIWLGMFVYAVGEHKDIWDLEWSLVE